MGHVTIAQAAIAFAENWPERRELNPFGRLGSPIPNRFTHYAFR